MTYFSNPDTVLRDLLARIEAVEAEIRSLKLSCSCKGSNAKKTSNISENLNDFYRKTEESVDNQLELFPKEKED
jgi:hypothetical protein